MNRLERVTFVLELARRMKERGSWSGETHLQKAIFFAQELLDVPLGFDFILYKHGPFSFDLRDELTAMRADNLLELRTNPQPYGPSLLLTEQGSQLAQHFPGSVQQFASELDFLANELGQLNVIDLERLATALYVTKRPHHEQIQSRVAKLIELKPHIPNDRAEDAVQRVDTYIAKVSKERLGTRS